VSNLEAVLPTWWLLFDVQVVIYNLG